MGIDASHHGVETCVRGGEPSIHPGKEIVEPFINVVEAPDAATIARVSVALGARGSTKIRTLTALSIDEFLGAVS